MLWQQHGVYPEALDCWECFQPPLFYAVVKSTSDILNLTTYWEIFYTIQAFNLFLQLGIIFLIIGIILRYKLPKFQRNALILFFTLNPELISIGALVTNDSLLILLSLASTYLFVSFLKRETLAKELVLFILLFLLGISKGNGLLFLGILPLSLLIAYLNKREIIITKVARQLCLYFVTVVCIAFFGNYVDKYEKHANPFITNVQPPAEKAMWNQPTKVPFREGVRTIKEAFFTFPIWSLIEDPSNETYQESVPHRRNLWTQLLGQYTNYLFEKHPQSWQSVNNDLKNISRVNYLLHLLLFTALFMTFLLYYFRSRQTVSFETIFHFICLLSFVLFLMKYATTYRDFSFMKVIFIFPALHSIIHFTKIGLTNFKWSRVFTYSLYCCIFLYSTNFIYLLRALMN